MLIKLIQLLGEGRIKSGQGGGNNLRSTVKALTIILKFKRNGEGAWIRSALGEVRVVSKRVGKAKGVGLDKALRQQRPTSWF
jgi:hypothetical protein